MITHLRLKKKFIVIFFYTIQNFKKKIPPTRPLRLLVLYFPFIIPETIIKSHLSVVVVSLLE